MTSRTYANRLNPFEEPPLNRKPGCLPGKTLTPRQSRVEQTLPRPPALKLY